MEKLSQAPTDKIVYAKVREMMNSLNPLQQVIAENFFHFD